VELQRGQTAPTRRSEQLVNDNLFIACDDSSNPLTTLLHCSHPEEKDSHPDPDRDGSFEVSTQIRHSVDTDSVELIDSDDELVIQRQCPVTWAGCQIIIDTRPVDIDINN
jgi:hypothetical protein